MQLYKQFAAMTVYDAASHFPEYLRLFALSTMSFCNLFTSYEGRDLLATLLEVQAVEQLEFAATDTSPAAAAAAAAGGGGGGAPVEVDIDWSILWLVSRDVITLYFIR